MAKTRTISAFVIDDGVLYRTLMADVLGRLPKVEVIGTASGADAAIEKLSLRPADVVFCDVHMPDKDGVDTLLEIRRRFSRTVVVMMSGISSRSAPIVIRALQLGALDFIPKPDGKTVDENAALLRSNVEAVLRLVRIRLNLHGGPEPVIRVAVNTHTPVVPEMSGKGSYAVVAAGVSTGGPEALAKFLPMLPAQLPVPVLVVQHMPSPFTKSLVASLARKSSIRVLEAEHGQSLEPSTVYIAPGGHHMTVRRAAQRCEIALNDGPPENSCRPSVDVLFRSVGLGYGDGGVIAVVMTGMGRDGLLGVRALKRKGAYCITQSSGTCAVYGMPRAVVEAGLSDRVLDIGDIASELCMLLRCGAGVPLGGKSA